MKYKLLLLTIIATLVTYYIYSKYYHMEINITSINSYAINNNYNESLSNEITNNNLNYKLNVDYSSSDLEIENLIALINNNANKIQSVIHNSEVIILSIGNIDMKTETTKVILQEYKKLFILLRKYNNKQIIILSPIAFKNISDLKELCREYNLNFINTSSYINDYSSIDALTPSNSKKIAHAIIKNIAY
jgi:hypothetical protein